MIEGLIKALNPYSTRSIEIFFSKRGMLFLLTTIDYASSINIISCRTFVYYFYITIMINLVAHKNSRKCFRSIQ